MKKINIQHDIDSRREISHPIYTPVTNQFSIESFTIPKNASSQTEKGGEDHQNSQQQERKKTKTGRSAHRDL